MNNAKNKFVFLEWCLETVAVSDDFNGDIEDLDHRDVLKDLAYGLPDAPMHPVVMADFADDEDGDYFYRLCLKRQSGTDDDGITRTLYAYLDSGKLPETFDDSSVKVPAKYHKELENWWKSREG